MPKRIAASTLNASTVDILNVIRQNASLAYQNTVPAISTYTDIPKVGQVIYGTPAIANEFINALVNRIASVRMQSAVFNNPYAILKKGYIEYGETIEEIFVNIARVYEYSAEKAEGREFKRSIPDVRSAFHVINWRVVYPVTIEDEQLRMAFLTADGVRDLIAKIVDQVYTAAEYDEFLLFKYMLVKGIGTIYADKIGASATDTALATEFRSVSNLLPFMSKDYNAAGVMNTTPKDRQVIFMDARYNAQFDVSVLAAAFNMEKADFMGRLFLIDNWDTFDNERFDVIRANSDGLEEVTAADLAAMANIKAIILDENWFQVYDNANRFTEKYVASGLYWNYFYHVWKTVSWSPFANAVAIYAAAADTAPESITATVTSVDLSDEAKVVTFDTDVPNVEFVQTAELTAAGIAVHKYGAMIIPKSKFATKFTLTLRLAGTDYVGAAQINSSNLVVGAELEESPDSEGG